MSHYDQQREKSQLPKEKPKKSLGQQINSRLTQIPHDKLLHLSTGLIIYSIIAVISPLIALTVVSIIAATKEVYDKTTGKGTPELADFIYTITTPLLLFTLTHVSNSFS